MIAQSIHQFTQRTKIANEAGITGVLAMPFSIDGIDVFVAQLDGAPGASEAASFLLSQDELTRARRFVFEPDRHRFIVARAGLRLLIGERLGENPRDVEFAYGERGKPRLSDRYFRTNVSFNVSHTGDIALYAIADGRDIGIDVEKIRRLPDADDVAANCFSNAEIEEYLGLDPSDKPEGFFNCWTRKEAFVKALGDGLNRPLDSFDVSLVPGEPAQIRRFDDQIGDACGWQLYSFSPLHGLVAAIAIQTYTQRSQSREHSY